LENKSPQAKKEDPISECIVVDEFKVSAERPKVLASNTFMEWEQRLHDLIVNNREGQLSCKECGQVSTKQHLKDHVETHLREPFVYDCNYCNSKFTRLRNFKAHLAPCIAKALMKQVKVVSKNESQDQESVDNNQPEPVRSAIVSVEEFEIQVDRHLGRGPSGPPYEWLCTKCDFKSHAKDYVIDHIENCHLQGLSFKCEHCQVVQSKHAIYKKHIKLCSKKSAIQ